MAQPLQQPYTGSGLTRAADELLAVIARQPPAQDRRVPVGR